VKLGFTWTQRGCTQVQLNEVALVLRELQPVELHHGCCVGADAQAHELAKHLGILKVGHPPTNMNRMALGLDLDVEWNARPYLDRNRDIVFTTDRLLAAPRGEEVKRSGTWATVRYARQLGRRIDLLPDGRRTIEGAPW
jgi:hypothetical protein